MFPRFSETLSADMRCGEESWGKNSKSQIPNPKKIPNTKLQNQTPPVGSLEWWEQPEMSNETLILKDASPNGRPFDLEERTAQFGESISRFSKKIPRDPTNNRLIDQLVGCGTSVGANYCEANEPVSKKDFRHRISRCIKEGTSVAFGCWNLEFFWSLELGAWDLEL